MRERESLFNEFIVEVRRREKEDKVLKKEQVCADISLRFMIASDPFFCYWVNSQKHRYQVTAISSLDLRKFTQCSAFPSCHHTYNHIHSPHQYVLP